MNMMQKIISLTLVVVMLLGMLPVQTMAAQSGTGKTVSTDDECFLAAASRDDSYLELSLEKYGKTIRATKEMEPTASRWWSTWRPRNSTFL